MPADRSADPPSDDLTRSLRAFQIHGHLRGAAVAALSSLTGAVGALVLLRDRLQTPAAVAWLLALLAVLGLRGLWVRAARRAVADGAPVSLARLRAVSCAHGLVWAALPLALARPWSQDLFELMVVGLGGAAVAGASVCLMYDALAAGLFALPTLLSLAVVLGAHPQPWPRSVVLTLALAGFVAVTLAAAARALRRSLRSLAGTLVSDAAEGRRSAASAALLRRVFEHVGEGLCMFDADGRLVAWNARMVELAGLDPARVQAGTTLRALLGHMAADGQFGTDAPQAELERRLAAVRGPAPAWGRLHRGDGRTIEMHSNPMPDGGLTLLAMDVTERRAAARALAEHRAMLALLLQNTEEGVWTIDNELKTVDANAAMCRMLGTGREALLGRSIYDFVDAENAAIFREQVQRRDAGVPGSYEITLRRADGSSVHTQNNPTPLFDARGAKVGAIGLFTDITPIKRAAAELAHTSTELARQTRVLGATLDSLEQGVLAVDREGRIEAWNQRAVELLETPPGLLRRGEALRRIVAWQLASGYFDHPGSEPQARSRAEVQRYVDGDDRAASIGHYWRERPDGRIIEVQVHRSPAGGEVRTYGDVTQRVLAQRALVDARDQAERANRAKSEFLSRMSHELRTPLNAVLGFAQLLERDDPDLTPGQRGEHVQQILRGARHLQVLINDVLDLARIDAGTLAVQIGPVALAPLIDACGRLMAPLALERGVRLELQPAPGLVLADPTRLQQVLLNLLSNAIKYNRAGGEVVLGAVPADGRLRIEVRDSGPGLAAEQQDRLFQAFERLGADRSSVEGAGIGLALCKSLVALMQGRIGVRSTVGVGSTFWVELPLADAAPAGARRAASPPAPPVLPPRPDGRPWRALYIEDNAVNQILVQSMLRRLPGLELVVADHPIDGLQRLRAETPDLLLLDIQLPDLDGYEVLRLVRADPATAGIPVVAVSANAMASDLQRAHEAGFDRYLTKPLDLHRLLDVVVRMLVPGPAPHEPAAD